MNDPAGYLDPTVRLPSGPTLARLTEAVRVRSNDPTNPAHAYYVALYGRCLAAMGIT